MFKTTMTCNELCRIFTMDRGIIVDVHRAELEEFELSSILSYSILGEEDRTFGAYLNEHRDDDDDWEEDYQRSQTTNNIHDPFQFFFPRLRGIFLREIRIEGISVLFVGLRLHLLREETKGYRQLVAIVRSQGSLYRRGDFSLNNLDCHWRCFAYFSHQQPECQVSLIPSKDVRFPGSQCHGGRYSMNKRSSELCMKAFARDQYEHELLG